MPASRKLVDARRVARPFVVSTCILALLTIFALLQTFGWRDQGLGLRRRDRSMLSRHTTPEEPDCRDVDFVARGEQCAFVVAYCGDDEPGLLPYLTIYYCQVGAWRALVFGGLAAWLGMLFTTIGIAASDFFSVNLSTIAGVLGLSESLAGVTFLAFGNGSPDVFSTFAAMGSHSGSMAVGELIGAASFITAVVAGSMALVCEFKVNKHTFVRDICFFIVAVSFSMVFLADGHLHLWECIAMICYYLFYVATVVGWHWISTRRRQRRTKDAASRGHFYGGPEALEPYRDQMEGDVHEAARSTDIRALEQGPYFGPLSPDEDERGRLITAEMTSSMRVSRPRWTRSNTVITHIRPSLVGALEFRSVLSSLARERHVLLRSLSIGGDRVNWNSADGANFRRSPMAITTNQSRPGTPMQQRSRALSWGGSPRQTTQQDVDMPSDVPAGSKPAVRFPELATTPRLRLQIPSTSERSSGQSSPSLSPFPALAESPSSMSCHENARPTPLLERRYSVMPNLDEPAELAKTVGWWPYRFFPAPDTMFGTLFPTLQDWTSKTPWDKLVSVISAPSIFLLVVTLPVVDADSPDHEETDSVHGSHGHEVRVRPVSAEEYAAVQVETVWQEYRRRARSITNGRTGVGHSPVILVADESPSQHNSHTPSLSVPVLVDSTKPVAVVDVTQSTSDVLGWNRWLVFVQLFAGPLFVTFIVWCQVNNNTEESPVKVLVHWFLCSLVFSLVVLAFLLLTTTPDRKPRYHYGLCFLGFVISVAWISTVAGEVVGVLKAFGVILGISEAVLGLTIFAVGNSLGDLVADVTVARLGYPVMALAACFGGPLLNILLGVGIGGAWMTITSANDKHMKNPGKPVRYKPYRIQVGGTLMVSAITVLVTLVVLLITVPLNKWVMSRKIGWVLISIWTVSTVVNLVVELTGVWEEIS